MVDTHADNLKDLIIPEMWSSTQYISWLIQTLFNCFCRTLLRAFGISVANPIIFEVLQLINVQSHAISPFSDFDAVAIFRRAEVDDLGWRFTGLGHPHILKVLWGTRRAQFFHLDNLNSMAMQINENVRSLLLCFDSIGITNYMVDRQLRKRQRMHAYPHSLVPWPLETLSSLH